MRPIVIPLPGSEALARRLALSLRATLGAVESRHFPDGETYLRLRTPVKKRRVIIAANLDRPDKKFLPLEFLAALARDLGSTEVGLIAPYLPYMRQDKRFHTGEAMTSDYFAALLSRAINWLVTVDPHLHRRKYLSDIYSVPTTVVHAAPLIAEWIARRVPAPLVIGPDEESAQWVAEVAQGAGAPYTVLTKRRRGDRSVSVSRLQGALPSGRTPVLVDDIVSTARTMIEAVKNIQAQTGKAPYCVAVHGLFSGQAYDELRRAGAAAVISCNTIPHRSNRLDATDLMAKAAADLIKRRQLNASERTHA